MLSFLVCQDFLVGTQLADSGSRWAIECIPALEEMERKKICVKTFEIVMLSFYMPTISLVMLQLHPQRGCCMCVIASLMLLLQG